MSMLRAGANCPISTEERKLAAKAAMIYANPTKVGVHLISHQQCKWHLHTHYNGYVRNNTYAPKRRLSPVCWEGCARVNNNSGRAPQRILTPWRRVRGAQTVTGAAVGGRTRPGSRSLAQFGSSFPHPWADQEDILLHVVDQYCVVTSPQNHPCELSPDHPVGGFHSLERARPRATRGVQQSTIWPARACRWQQRAWIVCTLGGFASYYALSTRRCTRWIRVKFFAHPLENANNCFFYMTHVS